MQKNEFFQLERGTDERGYRLAVQPQNCVHPEQIGQENFLMGGVSVGACILALEQTTQQPLICASAQFISRASSGDSIDIEVETPAAGRSITQARASARCGKQEVVAVMASLGRYDGYPDIAYARMPEMPPPEQCELMGETDREDDLRNQFVGCFVPGTPDNLNLSYIRPRHDEPLSSGLLAVMADFLAGGHDLTRGASSLDNVLRVFDLRPSEWLACETHFSGLRGGLFHAHMNIYGMDGRLMATAAQSGRLPASSKL